MLPVDAQNVPSNARNNASPWINMAYCSGNNTPIFKVSDTHLSLSQVFLYEQTLVCNISKPSIDVVDNQ